MKSYMGGDMKGGVEREDRGDFYIGDMRGGLRGDVSGDVTGDLKGALRGDVR